jgi:hypothetical protein
VCGPDPISTHAAATSAFRKISPVVSLTAPASNPVNDCTLDALGDPVCAEDIALSWEDYFDTNHERWYADGIAPSYQTAMKYRVQVSQSPTFDTLVDTQEVDQTTYTAFDKTWPEGELWWRVQGIDAENNHLAWSNVVKLTKDSGVVTTIAPGSDQTVSGSTSFRWEPKNFAASYRVEVYRNNDATFSPANLVFGIDTKLPSYVWSKYLPASAKAYRWRVRWSDGNGRVGRWSPAARFFVHPSAVSSRGPENGAIVAGNGAYFTWNASASAASYVVEARTAKGHDSVFRVTTPARAYAHTARLVKGSYQWRVGALDPSGGALGESKWLSFKVPR